MIRGTTPDIKIVIRNPGELDLAQAEEVYVTIRQGGKSVTKTGEEVAVETAAAAIWLTQDESLQFREGDAEAQINWIYQGTNGRKRAATKWTAISIDRQLLERVV